MEGRQPARPDGEPSLHPSNTSHTIETRYVHMLLELDYIPWFHNVLAGAASWLLLAGYLVVPGTFTSLQKSQPFSEDLEKTKTGQAIINTIQNPPLLAIACLFLALGASLMGWLFWERRNNYIWLVNRLFIPTLLNSTAGLVTTFVNVYTAREGDWSIMALLTAITTGLSLSVTLAMVIIYKFGKLEKVKEDHELEMKAGFRRVNH